MARQFKNRPKDMKISVYLIHTRMYAQMTVVGKINPRVYNYIIAEYLLTSAIYIISIFFRRAVRWNAEPDVETIPEKSSKEYDEPL